MVCLFFATERIANENAANRFVGLLPMKDSLFLVAHPLPKRFMSDCV
jgi:hypothetical protein